MQNYFIFSGGGGRVFSYNGVYRAYFEKYGDSVFKDTFHFNGCGSGALAAALFSIAAPPAEVEDLLKNINKGIGKDARKEKKIRYVPNLQRNSGFSIESYASRATQKITSPFNTVSDIFDIAKRIVKLSQQKSENELVQPLIKMAKAILQPGVKDIGNFIRYLELFFSDCGLNSFYTIRQKINNILSQHGNERYNEIGGQKNIEYLTFDQHRLIFKNDLTIAATRINDAQPIYFNATHTPNVIIADAVRVSMSTAILSKPLIHQDFPTPFKYVDILNYFRTDTIVDINKLLERLIVAIVQEERYLSVSEIDYLKGMLSDGSLVDNLPFEMTTDSGILPPGAYYVFDISSDNFKPSISPITHFNNDNLWQHIEALYEISRYNSTSISEISNQVKPYKLDTKGLAEFDYSITPDLLKKNTKANYEYAIKNIFTN